MLELLTAEGHIRTLILSVENKYKDTNIPKGAESSLNKLKSALKCIVISNERFKELDKDLKMKEKSMVYHSMNCAKLTALNGKAISVVSMLEERIENLKKEL